ncbi:isochorismatase family protein [Streptomyces sp. NPDC046979]|uniref:cysteine hydrolase family protein n=1 Tax=Streptomyces sp. NPDC046979 TaxID=3154604 RepID=UPI0033E086D4
MQQQMTPPKPDLQNPYTAPHFATSALVTIDVQRDFLSEAPYGVPGGTTEMLPALRRTVAAFRAAGRPVLYVVRLYEEGGGKPRGGVLGACHGRRRHGGVRVGHADGLRPARPP